MFDYFTGYDLNAYTQDHLWFPTDIDSKFISLSLRVDYDYTQDTDAMNNQTSSAREFEQTSAPNIDFTEID